MARMPASLSMAGMPEVSGAGNKGRGSPSVPSGATATPWPSASNDERPSAAAVWLPVAAPGRDCTATEPLSTDAVVWPDSPIDTSNRVPRTLVTA